MDGLLQDITIYHKTKDGYVRYNKEASVRNTSYLNRNKTGVSTSDNALIRVFDSAGYKNTWECSKGDVIVALNTNYEVIKAPLTELREKYGKEYVYEVSSIDIFKFENANVRELNHIKIGAK